MVTDYTTRKRGDPSRQSRPVMEMNWTRFWMGWVLFSRILPSLVFYYYVPSTFYLCKELYNGACSCEKNIVLWQSPKNCVIICALVNYTVESMSSLFSVLALGFRLCSLHCSWSLCASICVHNLLDVGVHWYWLQLCTPVMWSYLCTQPCVVHKCWLQ